MPGTEVCSVVLRLSCPAPVLSLPHTLALVCPTSSCCLIHRPVHHHRTCSSVGSFPKGTSSVELSVPETQSHPCLCSYTASLLPKRRSSSILGRRLSFLSNPGFTLPATVLALTLHRTLLILDAIVSRPLCPTRLSSSPAVRGFRKVCLQG